ncbi:MAG: hypothetical protein K0S32_2756 [Bacteroidetes bacterium]|jgi:hypothetical protein|nr:hypothetical protein [Bacteroidota bacterium]
MGKDWFDLLTEEEKTSIQKGLDDLKNRKIFSHEEVIKESKEIIRRKMNLK